MTTKLVLPEDTHQQVHAPGSLQTDPPLSGSRRLRCNPRTATRDVHPEFLSPSLAATTPSGTVPIPAPTCGGRSALPLPRRAPRRLHAGCAPPPARTLLQATAGRPARFPAAAALHLGLPSVTPPREQTDGQRSHSEARAGSGGGASAGQRPSGGRGAVEKSGADALTPGLLLPAHPGASPAGSSAPRDRRRSPAQDTAVPRFPVHRGINPHCVRQRARAWNPEAAAPRACSTAWDRLPRLSPWVSRTG